MTWRGNIAEDATFRFTFTTTVDGVPSTLGGTPALSVYKDSNLVQSTAGITLTVDYDGVTGLNHVAMVTTDVFYVAAADYMVVITTGTVGGNSVVGHVVGEFSIQNRFMRGTDSAALASVCTEVRLAELAAANLPADIDAILVDTGTTLQAEVDGIQADTEDIQARLPAALVGGRMDSSVGAVAAGAITAAAIATGAIDADALAADAVAEIIGAVTGTADAGSTASTIVDAERTEAVTNYWQHSLVLMTSGVNIGQVRRVTAFNTTTDTLTVAPAFKSAVAAGNTYTILATSLADGLRPTTEGNEAADVTATGAVGVDWANVEGPTTANNLSGTTVNLVNTVTTLTGHTAQTGDNFARLGAPAGVSVSADIAAVKVDTAAILVDTSTTIDDLVDDLESRLGVPSNFGSGATIAANLVDIEAQTDDIGAAGAGLTAVPWNTAWDAEVESEVNDALVVHRLDEILNADSDIDGLAPPTVGSVFHELLTKTAGSFTYDQTTDSLEAVRDRGDAAWVTGTAPTAAAVADAVWDEAQVDHAAAGSFGEVATETAAILIDTAEIGAAGAGLTEAGGTGDHLTAVPWNAAWDAEVESEANDALVAINLDHLVGTATGIPAIPAGTYIDQIMDDGTAAFDRTTDSLQAIRDTAPLGTAMRGTDSAALASVCTEARLAELDAANLPTDVAARATPAQVNAEVLDVMNTDTITLPGQVAPPLAPTHRQAISWLYKVFRNRKAQTATQWSLYADDETTIDAKATVSDDGTTAIKQEVASGP